MLQERELQTSTQQASTKVILVVENDADNREFFTLALSSLTPHQVLSAQKATEALSIVEQIKPGLFLLNYRLPDIDGLELYDRLHATQGLECIPAIILSSGMSDEVKREIERRQLVIVDMPFDLDDFLDSVNRALT